MYQNPKQSYVAPPLVVDLSIEKTNSILRLVYMWMGLGLLTTAITAIVIANNNTLLTIAMSPGMAIFMFISIIGISIMLGIGLTRNWLSPGIAITMFFVYAILMGVMLSSVALLANYRPNAIFAAAASATALFGAMTIVGFTTKMDLSRFGFFFVVALFGLIIAMIINMFLQSDAFGFIISVLGVLIFTGLTAYDTQRIKEMANNAYIQSSGSLAVKVSIFGALQLYLDFINLFLFLLQIFLSRE